MSDKPCLIKHEEAMLSRKLKLTAALCLLLATDASAGVLYVDLNSTNPVSPYTSWATAATNIQDAIDVASNGDQVLVTNGVYATGGRTAIGSGTATNRVSFTKPLTVQSVNGPAVTTIQGYQVPGATNGANAVRCVYMITNSTLIGFTLTNGGTPTSGLENGGGVLGIISPSSSPIVSNCVLTGNSAAQNGGGAYACTLNNCTLIGNSGYNGGGGSMCIMSSCSLISNSATYGGAVHNSQLYICVLKGNAAYQGGGSFGGALANSLLTGNFATNAGGGIDDSVLANCTLSGNSAGVSGGGIYYVYNPSIHMNWDNSIIYGNTAPTGGNYAYLQPPTFEIPWNSCCTTPLPTVGYNNFTNDPGFVNLAGGNFHLGSNSSCINAGNNAYLNVPAGTDLDGNSRLAGPYVDVGAYEYQSPASVIPYYWLQQYGLPTDGSADFIDSDCDGMSNWREWITGTDPTNAASLLQVSIVLGNSKAIVSWPSVTNRGYYLYPGLYSKGQIIFPTNFSSYVGSGTGGTMSVTNSASPSSPAFYRVGVQ
jgi:hypothetical protein